MSLQCARSFPTGIEFRVTGEGGLPDPACERSGRFQEDMDWAWFGAAILRSRLASFSLSVFQYLVIPLFAVRPTWSQLFLSYLGITLVSAAFVGLLLRTLPAVVVGKMILLSLVASLFVVYTDFISGNSITSDLFFPTTPSFASTGQAFMIFTLLGTLSSVLVRLLFKKWKW